MKQFAGLFARLHQSKKVHIAKLSERSAKGKRQGVAFSHPLPFFLFLKDPFIYGWILRITAITDHVRHNPMPVFQASTSSCISSQRASRQLMVLT